MQPPIAKKIAHKTEIHGYTLNDDYFWLREKENPEVLAYLNDENTFTNKQLEPTLPLQKKIFSELKGRIKERDESVPVKSGNYYYSTKFLEGKEYEIYCRRKGSLDASEEVLLDLNIIAKDLDYLSLGNYEWSNNHKILAYSIDDDGSEQYTLKFKNLDSGADLTDSIANTYYGGTWSKNDDYFFYVKLNDNLRPYQVWRHKMGTKADQDKMVFEETDNRFFLSCWVGRSNEFILIETHGVNTSEIHYLHTEQPEGNFQCFRQREMGVEYSLTHQNNRWLITTNEEALDFKVMTTLVGSDAVENWVEYIPHVAGRMIDGVTAFKNHTLVGFKEKAQEKIQVDTINGDTHLILFPEDVASIGFGSTFEYDTDICRLTYSSPITPYSVYDYDIPKKSLTALKTQEIPSGYDKAKYECKMVYAPARDSKEVPITLIYLKGTKLDSSHPLYLYAYGSYGMGMSDGFSTSRISLIDRGVVYGVAHIRGGDELGRLWYEEGKLQKKLNTFTDYIDCAKYLIDAKWTAKGKIAGCGGSAGGMLMGGVANMAGDLFASIAAHVPFVDCVNTMLDDTLPLTATEYNEWGNPNEKEAFDMIRSYSPYDNVKAQDYPNLLITAGLNDPRVTYWEPAKWTAKLRELKTNDKQLLLKTNMEAGHAGKSGRFESLHEKALEFAFVLNHFGIKD